MINDIYDFLPEYPNITKDTFYSDIYLKKEFNELKLEETENKHIDNNNSYYNHQKMISRFLSSNTNYNELLLFHEMGSGKSCVSVSVIEQIKNENQYLGALYLNKGETSINNFKKEIIYKCTNEKYLDDKKKLKEFYHFNTFEKFSKLYEKNPTYTSKKYNNFVIIIDEVHNLRIQGNIYSNISNFLHNIKGCKILLLSGTPMKDDISEISSIMNLILPEEEKFSVGTDFINEYFKKNELYDENMNIYMFKNDEKINKFKKKIKGRISYLCSMKPNNITINYIGKPLGNLKHLNVVQDVMSDFQSEHYNKSLDLDQKSDKDTMGVYINSREASLFVYPDGSYGSKGFSNYIEITTSKFKKIPTLSLKSNFKKILVENNTILKNIEMFSIKYAKTIENILENPKKCVFVYNSSVNGSGLILFGLLLELFGFKKCNKLKIDDETVKTPRYILLTSDSSSNKNISNIVDTFNNPKNYEGDYIRVILGSKKISEGLSFYNIQIEEILTPWFNYSETSQAISRGIRLESHKKLLENNDNVSVDIYQRVSMPNNVDIKSIDLYMYEISETKDISIKNVERVIKESCFDCQLNIKRNKKKDMYDGKRDCEYKICEYKCDGINEEDLLKELDYSTYQLLYSKTDNIINKIKEIFKKKFSIHYNDLIKIIKKDNDTQDFEIIKALNIIIYNNIIFNEKYYLKEDKNIFFLVDNILYTNDMFITYYIKHNIKHNKNKQKFNKILNKIYLKTTLKTIEKIFKCEDKEYLQKLLELIHPNKLIQIIIEQSLIAKIENKQTNNISRDLLLEHYKYYYNKYYYKGKNIYLLYYNEKLRCLNKDKWIDCDKEIKDFYINKKETEKQNIIDKCIKLDIGFYGIHTYTDDKFYIVDISKDGKDKKSAQNRGKECISNGGWTPDILVHIIINKLKIRLDDDNFFIKEKDNILIDMQNKKNNFNTKNNSQYYKKTDIHITTNILNEIQKEYKKNKQNVSSISLKKIMINIILENKNYKKIIKNKNFDYLTKLDELDEIFIINILWYFSLSINDLCIIIKNIFIELEIFFITNNK